VNSHSDPYDVIVAGAGPAGSACAWFAARAGLRVLLLDAAVFPRDKACGDAIGRATSAPILRDMGLLGELDRLAAVHCHELSVVSSTGAAFRVRRPRHWEPSYQAHRICPRSVFDAWLLSQVSSDVDVRQGVRVTGLLRRDGAVTGITGRDMPRGQDIAVRARVVIGADGAHSVIARGAGLQRDTERPMALSIRGYFRGVEGVNGRLEFHYTRRPPGGFWIFPCGEGLANVGIGFLGKDLDRRTADLTELLWGCIRHTPHLRERFRRAELIGPLRGAPVPLWQGWRRLSGDGVMLIGDAACLVDPVSGEGIGNAMLSGKLAAHAASQALKDHDVSANALWRYDASLHRALGRGLRLARVLQWCALRPWHMDTAITIGASHRGLAHWLQRVVTSRNLRRVRCASSD
jgi:geranylgeranyl reductase family protein